MWQDSHIKAEAPLIEQLVKLIDKEQSERLNRQAAYQPSSLQSCISP
jgi:hypothetical protein